MIISHKHKFIFIKTHKTASTSMEIALSKYCGADDIITKLLSYDERKRIKAGQRWAQNYKIPFSKYSFRDYLRAIRQRQKLEFYSHVGASYILKYIDKDIWDSYYKFCFERNPWDKMVSWYYWYYQNEDRPSISEFLNSDKVYEIQGLNLYSINSQIVVDKVYFYEDLEGALKDISEKVGFSEVPSLPFTKTNFRKDKRNYREILSKEDKERIADVFSREIELFNYEW